MKHTKFITAKEVARLMGVPLATVSRWAHQGKIPCKLNKQDYVFSKIKIISWAKSHQFHIQDAESRS
jgi:phage terminase Nu1 subunit (DNA packaging protein)